jgi:hypothetical protein
VLERQNRTVTIHLGNTLAEHQEMISMEEGVQKLIRRVEIADSLNWGCLAERCSNWDNILPSTNASAKKPVGLSLSKKETNIRNAFLCVLNALTPKAYQEALVLFHITDPNFSDTSKSHPELVEGGLLRVSPQESAQNRPSTGSG